MMWLVDRFFSFSWHSSGCVCGLWRLVQVCAGSLCCLVLALSCVCTGAGRVTLRMPGLIQQRRWSFPQGMIFRAPTIMIIESVMWCVRDCDYHKETLLLKVCNGRFLCSGFMCVDLDASLSSAMLKNVLFMVRTGFGKTCRQLLLIWVLYTH